MDFKSSPLPNSPHVQASVRASYTWRFPNNVGNLVGNITANYTSADYMQYGLSNVPVLREEELLGPGVLKAETAAAHALVNLRLQWDNPLGVYRNLSVAAYVTNLFNVTYATGNIDYLWNVGINTQDFGPPREFGIEISAKY
jgi:outer membrane receptor protein involved in Fe transport